ncbi:tetratricopeptide repeat protein [Nannocystaceae bacterium ST9]
MPTTRLRQRLRLSALSLTVIVALAVGCRREHTESPPDPTEEGSKTDAGKPGPKGPGVDEGHEHGGFEGGGIGPDLEAAPVGPRVRDKVDPPQTRDAALIAVSHANPEGAIEFLTKHVGKQPDDHEAALALAWAQRLVGDRKAAEKTLGDLIKRTKDSAIKVEATRRLARLARMRGDAKQAEQHLRDATKLAPDDLLIKGELVNVLVLTGRRDAPETRQMVDALYDAYGNGSAQTAGELLGAAHAGLAEFAFKSANRVLGEAETAAPASSGSELADEIAMLRAGVFLEKYKPEEAAETLAMILQRDPWNSEALAMLSVVMLDQFQLAAASRIADETLLVDPGNPDAHATLAWIALIEGRREEARDRVTKHVIAANPSHAAGQAVLAALAFYDRKPKDYAKARDAVLAFNPKDGLFFADLGDLLGYLHLYPEADEILTDGIARLPDDPYVQGAFGLSKLRLGDETAGREALEKAWKKDKYNERTLNVRQLYSERIVPNYTEQVHGDLTLRLPTELQDVVSPGFVAAIGKARKSLDAAYGVKISPLRIEMFADPDDFSVRTVGVPSLGAVGVCFGPVITSIGPYAGTHNFDQVIWHEIAHSYAISLSEGRVPRWFTEGLSEWESEVADPSWARESAALLFEARRADKLRKLSELELAFLRAESSIMMEVAYSTAAWAMRYIGETYGRPKIVEMLRGYAKGKSTEQLFVEVLGKDMPTVEKEFEAWFDQQLDAKLSGWRPSPDQPGDERMKALELALGQAGEGKFEAAQATLEKLIKDQKGDGFQTRMTLAAVLERRDDDKGAIANYEKAAAFARESIEPLVAIVGLAEKQGDFGKQLDVLEQILAIEAMDLTPALKMIQLAAMHDDKRLAAAVERATAIAPLHPTVLAANALLAHRAKASKTRVAALLDVAMKTALLPDATGEVVIVTALAAAEIGDPRVRDLAARALKEPGLPDRAKKLLEKHVP